MRVFFAGLFVICVSGSWIEGVIAQAASISTCRSGRSDTATVRRIKPAQIIPANIQPARVKPAQIIPGGPGKPPRVIRSTVTSPKVTPPQVIPPQLYTEVRETATETRVILAADILFDFDQSNLRSEAVDNLQQILPVLQDPCNDTMVISGHTDAKGSDSYNQALSERRAIAVKQWLMQHEIVGDRMTTRGWGKSQPITELVEYRFPQN
jgi:outer membrane protein OmpA-like peptidoglycan-associated protein